MILPPNIPLYGNPDYRGPCSTEAAESVTFFNAIRRTKWGTLALHIKNEGRRSHGQAAWDKAQGLVTGAADIIIPGAPSFVCELKRQDHTKSRISKEQIAYLEAAQDAGAFVCVALGWQAAMEAVGDWSRIVRQR
jgi:hypothetical protein